jgi:hypothetical protein
MHISGIQATARKKKHAVKKVAQKVGTFSSLAVHDLSGQSKEEGWSRGCVLGGLVGVQGGELQEAQTEFLHTFFSWHVDHIRDVQLDSDRDGPSKVNCTPKFKSYGLRSRNFASLIKMSASWLRRVTQGVSKHMAWLSGAPAQAARVEKSQYG